MNQTRKEYINITGTLLKDINEDSPVQTLRFRADDPDAPSSLFLQTDPNTYIEKPFRKGDRIRVISGVYTEIGAPNFTPAVIAGEDFTDIFNDDIGALRAWRNGDRAMQDKILARMNGPRYEQKQGPVRIHFDDAKAKAFYSVTKDTFSPAQRSVIEDWLSHYRASKNSEKLDIIFNIVPSVDRGVPRFSIDELKTALDEKFFGMEKAKAEIIRHMATTAFTGKGGTVICLVGPAGTGKSRFGRTIADVINRPFFNIPCSSFTNSLDITGERTTYSDSRYGAMVDAYNSMCTTHGVVFFDEFDKMPGPDTPSKDGNCFNALLPVFSEKIIQDTYLGCEIDCSNTIFICACNSLDNVPSFIKNRFDIIIRLEPYTDEQLLSIARSYTIPRLNRELNIRKDHIAFSDKALRRVLRYIDDFGARRTEHNIEAIYKSVIAGWAETNTVAPVKVTVPMVDSILKDVVDLKDPRVIFRQHMEAYSAQAREKIISLSEKLDNPHTRLEDRELYRRQLEYLVGLRPCHEPFTIDVDRFYDEVNKTLYGMEREKDLLISTLYQLQAKKGRSNKRIFLVGSPGVGKSALVEAAGKASGMNYIRISLNGLQHAEDITGWGLSWKACDSGVIVRESAKAGSTRNLIQLDEIDKASPEVQAALISLLDDSGQFSDSFLEGIPIDFSDTVFIATGNGLDLVPALLSRFTVINVGSYTSFEKEHILREYLIPDACSGWNGKVTVDYKGIRAFIQYVAAGGVRELKGMVNRVVSETAFYRRGEETVIITEDDVYSVLGPVPAERGNRPMGSRPGVSNGLAVTGTGDGMCFSIQTRVMPGSGLEITGLPSEVITDSVKLAMANLTADYGMDFTDKKVHVHFAEGAVKKDGPSAGTSILMSLYSAMTGEAIPRAACYTGEIDLMGYVWAVGGIVEKVGSADRAGLETAYIPKQNYDTLTAEEWKKLNTMKISIVPVSHISEIINDIYGARHVEAA